MARIDVIIPCYNYAHLLPECVASVLSDRVTDVRLTIIDNASTDDSLAVAKGLARNDNRIQVIEHPENLGPQASFNEGIDVANGDYLMILCADDIASASGISKGVEILDSRPEVAFVYGSYVTAPLGADPFETLNQSGEPKTLSGEDLVKGICRLQRRVSAHALLVRTALQKRAGHYRTSLPYFDDVEMVLRLAQLGSAVELSEPLAVQRLHAGNLSRSLWNDRLRSLRELDGVFSSFFANEGRTIAKARRFRLEANLRLGNRAMRSLLSTVYHGQAGGCGLFSYGLRKYASGVAGLLWYGASPL